MKAHPRKLIWLVVFMTACLALTWTILVTLRREIQGDTYTYTAQFTDVTGLREGSDVRVAGVRVGRVDSVTLDNPASGEDTLATVRFRVQRDQPIYGNTKASVVYQNIIGQRYIGLTLADFGQPARLADGAAIPVDHTEPSFDVTNLLNGFEPMFTLLDPTNRGNLSNALINALQGDSDYIVILVSETSQLAQSLAGPDQILGRVIDSLNAVTENLASRGTQLHTTLTQMRSVIAGLNAHRDELVNATSSIATVISRLSAITTAAQPDLHDLLSREPGMLSAMVANKDSWATLGSNLPALLKGLSRVTGDSTALNGMACDFNITVFNFLKPIIPTIVNTATPGGQRKYSAKCR
ncbi:MlaD family protein [Mycolicibacterium sp. J2]|uniref:MlaD family protein n=1 Tax=Mycolicibacterium sp. J2 TaxID=2993511 RepID=UPI00224B911A|nr:MlaD family protein [Mycolicibacterium sp. J2]MCX2716019.1 MlaD family protein [Mycolicibacterium sp. J2]